MCFKFNLYICSVKRKQSTNNLKTTIMATMTKKQFCESVYSMYKLLGGDGCAQCCDDRVSCGYRKENTVLTNAIIHACNVHNVPFTIDCNKHCINIVVDFSK